MVSCGWNGERDIKEFVHRYGEAENYFGEDLGRVDSGYDRLEESLDRMLVVVGNSESFAAHMIHRIDWLRHYVLAKSSSEGYRALVAGHLDYCRFASLEYFRLIPHYRNGSDRNWLFPLICLADHLVTAASGLSGMESGQEAF